MSSIGDAKKRLLVNIFTNFLNVGVTSLIILWLTPYLIRNLGVSVYGLYPLIASIVLYVMILSQNFTSAISRFMAFSIDQGDHETSHTYFSTAMFTLLAINVVIFIIVLFVSFFLASIINIPPGHELDTAIFFVLMISSGLINSFTSPFWVSTFVTHRLYCKNIVVISSRLLQLIIIVTVFSQLGASLAAVGVGRSGMFLFQLVAAILLTRRFLPDLALKRSHFSAEALREMGFMGGWMTVDTLGALLLLSTDLLVINLLAGSKNAGLYAIVLQWVVFLKTLAPAMSSSFAPIAMDFIAKKRFSDLAFHAKRSIKFIGLLLALPVGLIVGLSSPLLEVWVGPSFCSLSPLMQLLIFPQIIFLSVNPLYNINRGMNKVKIPALATLLAGVFNIILSAVMLKFTTMGLYGVAGVTVFVVLIRCLGFTPIYAALNLGMKWSYFISATIPGTLLTVLTAFLATTYAAWHSIHSYLSLAVACGFVGALSLLFLCFVFLNRDDRKFFLSLVVNKAQMKSCV